MDKDAKIASQINKLEEKYKNSGQDLSSYLDGLLYERYLTYWDYIHLDTLLSLQVPRTHFPDEEIFIMYHQITELYFKLILHEEKQIVEDKSQDVAFFIEKVRRINSYFKALISSFSIMIKGMEREQFPSLPDGIASGEWLSVGSVSHDRILCHTLAAYGTSLRAGIIFIGKQHRRAF